MRDARPAGGRGTDDLIGALVEDLPRQALAPVTALRLAAAYAAGSVALLVALALLFNPSPHLVHPDGAWLATSTVTALAGAAAVLSASALALRLADPTAERPGYGPLLIGPAILALGLGLELALVPSGDWVGRLWGQAPLDCMASVAGLSLPLLAAALLVLRNGATRRPSLVGGLAGLAAGSLAACLYLLHCPESSLLFTAAWHGPAILMTAALGAAAGRLILRW